MKIAMLRLDRELSRSGLRARLLLQVHDELLLEVERPDVAATADLLRMTMEGAAELLVPLETEVRAGANWDELAPVPELVARAS
jgi:DNA polymerase-1